MLEYSHITVVSGGKKTLAVKKKLGRRILTIMNRFKVETGKHCKKMFKRLRKEKDHLFIFLDVEGSHGHNNS